MKRLALTLMVVLTTVVAFAAGYNWGTVKLSRIWLINPVSGDTYAYIDSSGYHGNGANLDSLPDAVDSAVVESIAGSLIGDSIAGKVDTGSAANTAPNADLLQGQDTTALWNAKTLQGKDTLALKQQIPTCDITDLTTSSSSTYMRLAPDGSFGVKWDGTDSTGKSGWAGRLQGQDTTALWNAKTLQTKDTTALFAAKTAAKIASNGDSAKVWGMTTPSTQGWMTGGGSSFSDTMWYTPQTLTVSSGRTAWNGALGGRATVTMTSADTMSKPTNMVNGRLVTLAVCQDSTGGRLMAWDYHFRFCGDTASAGYATAAPTLTATGWGGDLFTFLVSNDSFLYFQSFSPAVFRAYKP